MPLTPQDVQNKIFSPTRFRRGYDEHEVDSFLDEVDAEFTRLHQELDALRAQLGQSGTTAEDGDESLQASVILEKPDVAEQAAAAEIVEAENAPATTEQPPSASVSAALSSAVGTKLEQQVARTLVLAQRAADEAVRDAEQVAERTRNEARAEAERTLADVQHQVNDERQRLERDKQHLEDQLEQLRAFEREYRMRLRAYLELQLRELDGGAQQAVAGVDATALAAPSSTDAGPHEWSQPETVVLPESAESRGQSAGAPVADASDAPDESPRPRDPQAGGRGEVSTDPSAMSEPAWANTPKSSSAKGVTPPTGGEDPQHEPHDLHDEL